MNPFNCGCICCQITNKRDVIKQVAANFHHHEKITIVRISVWDDIPSLIPFEIILRWCLERVIFVHTNLSIIENVEWQNLKSLAIVFKMLISSRYNFGKTGTIHIIIEPKLGIISLSYWMIDRRKHHCYIVRTFDKYLIDNDIENIKHF